MLYKFACLGSSSNLSTAAAAARQRWYQSQCNLFTRPSSPVSTNWAASQVQPFFFFLERMAYCNQALHVCEDTWPIQLFIVVGFQDPAIIWKMNGCVRSQKRKNLKKRVSLGATSKKVVVLGGQRSPHLQAAVVKLPLFIGGIFLLRIPWYGKIIDQYQNLIFFQFSLHPSR